MRYLVYCDESSSQGKYYVDFFGGCIVEAGKKHYIEEDLNDCKRQLRLNSEIKCDYSGGYSASREPPFRRMRATDSGLSKPLYGLFEYSAF